MCPTFDNTFDTAVNAEGLVGASIEVNISVEDIPVCVLLDASATVLVMSQLFYEKTRVTYST